MSEPREPTLKSSEAWLESADEDLGAGRRDLEPPPYRRDAFHHAQQAAEKALKAYLVALGRQRIPRTHKLEALAREVRAAGGQEPPGEALEYLESYPSYVRYPDTASPSESEAAEAIEFGAAMVAFVRQALADVSPEREEERP